MRLSRGTANLFVVASFVATTVVSRSRAQEQLVVTDRDAAPKYDAKKEITDTGILMLSPPTIAASSNNMIDAVEMEPSSNSAARSLLLTAAMPLTMSVAPQCAAATVDCVYGMVRGSVTTTCAAACGPSCCVGAHACTSFTGKLCKDGSCNGAFACTYASIPSVVMSCKGDYACYNTGYYGAVGNISMSCNGIDACCYLGTYGAAGRVQDSCNAHQACESVAYKGSIGHLTSSCKNGNNACQKAGSPTNGTGTIPYNLLNCCNDGDSICLKANKDTLPTNCWSDTKVRMRRRCCIIIMPSS